MIMNFYCMNSILVWFLQSFTTEFATIDFVHFFAIIKRFLLQLVAHDTYVLGLCDPFHWTHLYFFFQQ